MIIFLTIPQQQVMAPEILQPGPIDAKSSRTTGASNNVPPSQTQQHRTHQLVNRGAPIVATENMTHDVHSKIVGKNRKQQEYETACNRM